MKLTGNESLHCLLLQGVSKSLGLRFFEDISASIHPISKLFFSAESCATYGTFKLRWSSLGSLLSDLCPE